MIKRGAGLYVLCRKDDDEDESKSRMETQFHDKPGPLTNLGFEEDTYQVESISGHTYDQRARRYLFHVNWKGYGDAERTWEPVENMLTDTACALLEEYCESKKIKINESKVNANENDNENENENENVTKKQQNQKRKRRRPRLTPRKRRRPHADESLLPPSDIRSPSVGPVLCVIYACFNRFRSSR